MSKARKRETKMKECRGEKGREQENKVDFILSWKYGLGTWKKYR